MITAEKLKSIIPKSTPKQRLEKEKKKLKKTNIPGPATAERPRPSGFSSYERV